METVQRKRERSSSLVVVLVHDRAGRALLGALVGAAVPVSAGDRVLDLCAAPGGKATAIAQRGARVVATDLNIGRVGLIGTNKAALGLDDLHLLAADGSAPPFAEATFDAVLVDAPCSGLGALRRRPDARWRIQPGDVAELASLQQRILTAAARNVRSGGSLVYSVCTLTRAESTDVVAATAALLADLGYTPLDPPAGDGWEPYGSATAVLVPGPASDGMALARWKRT